MRSRPWDGSKALGRAYKGQNRPKTSEKKIGGGSIIPVPLTTLLNMWVADASFPRTRRMMAASSVLKPISLMGHGFASG